MVQQVQRVTMVTLVCLVCQVHPDLLDQKVRKVKPVPLDTQEPVAKLAHKA